MLLGGDEIGRTQQGNNNGYCQDNEISWFDWQKTDPALLEFTQRLIRLRKEHPVFRRRRWFQGRPIHGSGVDDIGWFRPDGEEMSEEDWKAGFAKSLGVLLNGEGIASPDPHGNRIIDDSFYVLLNGSHEPVDFVLPPEKWGREWQKVLETSESASGGEGRRWRAGETLAVEERSVVVLVRRSEKR